MKWQILLNRRLCFDLMVWFFRNTIFQFLFWSTRQDLKEPPPLPSLGRLRRSIRRDNHAIITCDWFCYLATLETVTYEIQQKNRLIRGYRNRERQERSTSLLLSWVEKQRQCRRVTTYVYCGRRKIQHLTMSLGNVVSAASIHSISSVVARLRTIFGFNYIIQGA